MTKIYLAGPLFSLAEQGFNAELARFLEREGFEVWLPQEHGSKLLLSLRGRCRRG